MDLLERMHKISANVKQQHDILLREDEEATKQVSVRPFIAALGYEAHNLLEVKSQYIADPRTGGNEKVDYAIMRDRQPIILVEAKRARHILSEDNWRQLHDYFSATEVRFAILTNGIEYQFYTDLKKRNIMDRVPFYSFNILNLEKKVVKVLKDFTKETFNSERILSSARKLAVFRAVKKEFEQPSDEFVAHFSKSITSKELSKTEIQEFSTVIKEGIREYISGKIIAEQPTTVEIEPSQSTSNITENMNEMLISRKRRIIEIPIIGEFEGEWFDATLLFDTSSKLHDTHSMSRTKIRFRNRVVSVNEAELIARQSVTPDAKPLWKGWDRWQLHDSYSGELREIRRLLDDKALRALFVKDD